MTAAPLDTESSSSARRPRQGRHSLLKEIGGTAALLISLEVLMFWGYFTGVYTPPWDFMGSYNTEAYAWWAEGSFFNPTDWISHSWGGYPAAASIQNSAWYLPVGLVALVTPFSIHASAALAAAHYAFGAAGVYVLGRAFNLGRLPSTFGLVAYFFVAGFYAQAQHVDIARGYAWLPWIFLITSPKWPWRRWWGVPLAALALWQALLGMYPGMIVAAGYAVIAWIIAHQWANRTLFTRYLLPLGVAGLTALMLSAPKYVPALLLDQAGNGEYTDASEISWSLVATAFLPYGNPALPADISLRSFFLPATCFVLVGLANLRGALQRALLAVLGVSLLLGVPGTPWHQFIDLLPGLSFSRYRLSDFRSIMLLATCLLAMTVLARAIAAPARTSTRLARRDLRPLAWLAALPIMVLILSTRNNFDAAEWSLPLIVLVASGAVVALTTLPLPASLIAYRTEPRAGAVMLIFLSLLSGTASAYATSAPWRSPRIYAETVSFGKTVDQLLSETAPSGVVAQRPARTPLPEPLDPAQMVHTMWNGGYYNDTDSVGGLVNLKRSESFRALQDALLDPARSSNVNSLLAAPGIAIEIVDGSLPSQADIELCVVTQDCGRALSVEPDTYESGHLAYTFDAKRPTIVVLNESYYSGWHGQLCDKDEADCRELQVGRGPAGLMMAAIPAGQWLGEFDYIPPGSSKAWIAFASSVGIVTVWPVLTIMAPSRRTQRQWAKHRIRL